MQSRQSLELRQHQQLALTPQLQQSIRFLQLSTYELEQEVAQAVLENPLLESGTDDSTDTGDTVAEVGEDTEDHWAAPSEQARSGASDDDMQQPEAAGHTSLADHLLEQLRLTRAQPRDAALVTVLIDELDENGYLSTTLDEILQVLPLQLQVTPDELMAALRLLQSFDPPGVGARSLSECLVLQLDQRGPALTATAIDPVLACARALAKDHLELLASASLQRLRSVLDCSQETLRAAHALLLSLEPRPGRAWAASVADYAVPDVLVRKQRGRWVATVNPAVMPRIRVNADYARALHDTPSSPMQAQLQQAYGLVKSVSQRFATIVRVTQAIVDRQQAFFEQGMGAMRPLVLRDIAQELQMHESTISRATKQKFVQTPWGVLELKRFFGSSLQTDDGAATSATAVQMLIRQLVAQEPAGKPLSDSQLAQALSAQGVAVARRTVAKYREAAGIAPASVRKARGALEAL